MTTVRDVLGTKGRDVWAISTQAWVWEAVDGMNERQIGSLVVTEGGLEVAGIFTERDVLRRVVAAGRDPRSTRVREVMTTNLVSVTPSDDIYDVLRLMTETRHRHMPVFDGERLEGLVSIGDLTDCALREMDGEVVELTQYIAGPSVRTLERSRRFSRVEA